MFDASTSHIAFSAITREHAGDDEAGTRLPADLELHHFQSLLFLSRTLYSFLRDRCGPRATSPSALDNAFVLPKCPTGQSIEQSLRRSLSIGPDPTTKRSRSLRPQVVAKVSTSSTKSIGALEASNALVAADGHQDERPAQVATGFAQLLAKTKRCARHIPSIFLVFPTNLRAYVESAPQEQQWSQQGPRKRFRKSPLSSSETTSGQSNTPSKSAASKQGPQVKFSVFSKNPLTTAQLGCFVGKVNGELPQCQGPKCHWKCARTLSRSPHLGRHVDDGNITAQQLEIVKDVATQSLKDKPEEAWRKCFVYLYPAFAHLKEQLNPYHGEPLLRGVANPWRHVGSPQDDLRVPIRGSHYTGLLQSRPHADRSSAGLSNTNVRAPHPQTPPARGSMHPPATPPRASSGFQPTATHAQRPLPISYAGVASGRPPMARSSRPYTGSTPLPRRTSSQQSFASGLQSSPNNHSPLTPSPRRVTELNAASGQFSQYRSTQPTSTGSPSLTNDDSTFQDDSSLFHRAATPNRDSQPSPDQYLFSDLFDDDVPVTSENDDAMVFEDLEKMLISSGNSPTDQSQEQPPVQWHLGLHRDNQQAHPHTLCIDPRLLEITPSTPTRTASEYSNSRKRPARESPSR